MVRWALTPRIALAEDLILTIPKLMLAEVLALPAHVLRSCLGVRIILSNTMELVIRRIV